MRRFPTRTVLRHDDARIEFFERRNRRLHDWLEDRPREMEAADDRMNAIYPRHLPRALQCVHHAGVTATGQHDEPFALHVDHDRLIVVNPRIRLPLAIDQRELIWTALLERRRTRDLPGDQRMTADQHRRTAIFDNLDIFGFEVTPVRRKM